METVGIMLTYLVFMRLTIYTQKRKLNFKKLQVFKGMRVFVPVLLIVISLFLYPFAALAIFLLLFMVEILAQIKSEIPEDRQLSKGELTKYIVIGSLLTTVSMIAVKFIPAAWYYALGGAVGLFLCGFVWWLGQDRDRLSGIWDTVILLSFIPLGLFGFDMADWMDDMRRSVNPTRIAYNLPFIFLPVFYVGFLMANILFGVFSLSGMCTLSSAHSACVSSATMKCPARARQASSRSASPSLHSSFSSSPHQSLSVFPSMWMLSCQPITMASRAS